MLVSKFYYHLFIIYFYWNCSFKFKEAPANNDISMTISFKPISSGFELDLIQVDVSF